jgi:hypothetical protein
LVPDLLAVQSIAYFEENVHILYMTEIARNSGLLLLIYTLANPKKRNITICNLHSTDKG